jgi:hypothetical protein
MDKVGAAVVILVILAAAPFVGKIPQALQHTGAKESPVQSGQTSAGLGIVRGDMAGQCRRMLDMVEQMTFYQMQMGVTLTKLTQSVSDLQNEKDTAPLRPKLGDLGGMLDEMQIYLGQQSNVTKSMTEQLRSSCPVQNPEKPGPR